MHTMAESPHLALRDVWVRHGDLPAVRGLNLALPRASVGCIIGANGAGKSSTLNAIAGLLPAQGEILFDGMPVGHLPADRRVTAGIALVPEGRGILASLTVAENLQLGGYSRGDRRKLATDIEDLLARLPRLRERYRQPAGTLSGGEQQMLAIARALLAAPRLLLLDEPSMGLAPRMCDAVFALIAEVAGSGVTILLVEQNAQRALEISDHAWVLAAGECVLSGRARDIAADGGVQAGYLGGEAT